MNITTSKQIQSYNTAMTECGCWYKQCIRNIQGCLL